MATVFGKVWGKTSPLFNKNNVEIHRIEAKAGHQCSEHKHVHKYNAFFIESGKMQIKVWKNNYDLVDVTEIGPGEMAIVDPGEFHQFIAIEDTIAYEIYWVELLVDDIERRSVGN